MQVRLIQVMKKKHRRKEVTCICRGTRSSGITILKQAQTGILSFTERKDILKPVIN
jgi:hypothetical protein